MGQGYTRTNSADITPGAVVKSAPINAEFNAVVSAFASSTGHTHDGTSAEGGPITKLLGMAITIGDATAGTDIVITFDGETNDGVLTWMEDEDYFKFSDDILIDSDEKLQFRDTGIYISSNADGDLDIVSDGTAVDSINIESAGGITLDAGTAGSGIIYEDDGTEMLRIYNSSSDVYIESKVSDKDILIRGNDGGSPVTAVTFDMSAAGLATFGGGITSTAVANTLGATTFSGGLTSTASSNTLGATSFNDANITNVGNIALDSITADGSSITITGNTTFADGAYDFDIASHDTSNGLKLGGTLVTATAAEINKLDGVNTTTDEINLIAGGASRGTTAVASGDGILINDDGTMRMTNVDTVSTYFDSISVGGSNIVTTGALDSGSITSGFGAIDNGTSGIRTNTVTVETSLLPDFAGQADIGSSSAEFGDIYIADDKYIKFGTHQDIFVGYDEDGDDALEIRQNIEGDPLAITFKADQGDDNADQWKLNFADGGTVTFQNKTSGSYGTMLTLDTSGNLSTGGKLDVSGLGGGSGLTVSNGIGEFADGLTSVMGNTSLGATSFNDSNITNVGDIALDSISADATDINVAVSDNSATAFTIKQGSDAYLIIDTANSSESVSIGTGVSGTAITLGHTTSEVTVADNLTVTGTLGVSADADATTTLGRAKIGSPASDVAYFSHVDFNTTTSYALAQTSSGLTAVNAASGQTINFNINDVNQAQISASGLTVDNVNIDGNTIISTNTNGDINLTPNGTGKVNITSTSTENTLQLTSADATNASAPDLIFDRNSSSPADNDFLGRIDFQGRNSAAQTHIYGGIFSRSMDVTDGTEDGQIHFSTSNGGTLDTTGDLIINSGLVTAPKTGFYRNELISSSQSFSGQTLSLIGTADGAFTDDYDIYEICFKNLIFSNDDNLAWIRLKDSSNSTIATSSYGYYNLWLGNSANVQDADPAVPDTFQTDSAASNTTAWQISGKDEFSVGNESDEGFSALIRLYNTRSTSFPVLGYIVNANYLSVDNYGVNNYGSSWRSSVTAAVNGCFLFPNTGTIASGEIAVYGYKSSGV